MHSSHSTARARITAGLILTAGLAAHGCTISPVVTAPLDESGRYQDCERASQLYCGDAVGATGGDRDKCVAEHTYECVSGS